MSSPFLIHTNCIPFFYIQESDKGEPLTAKHIQTLLYADPTIKGVHVLFVSDLLQWIIAEEVYIDKQDFLNQYPEAQVAPKKAPSAPQPQPNLPPKSPLPVHPTFPWGILVIGVIFASLILVNVTFSCPSQLFTGILSVIAVLIVTALLSLRHRYLAKDKSWRSIQHIPHTHDPVQAAKLVQPKTKAILGLGASLVSCDQRVDMKEIQHLLVCLEALNIHLTTAEIKDLVPQWLKAIPQRKDDFPYYLRALVSLLNGDVAALERVMDFLATLAMSNGDVADEEIELVRQIAEGFGLNADDYVARLTP
jgi:uncharacterized tellurite resistance protein B-like protein